MRRGDVVVVAMQGDHGKPRPALVVQTDQLNQTHATVVLVPFSSFVVDAPLIRLTVEPSAENGLAKTSQVMVDKLMSIRTGKVGQSIGRLSDSQMLAVNRMLILCLGIG